MANQKIQVTVRNVYGKETVYPICEKAHTFAKLVGQKTLTMSQLRTIKELGYEIEAVPAKFEGI